MEVGFVALLLTTAIALAFNLKQRYGHRGLLILACVLWAAVMTRRDAAVLHVVISTYAVWASRRAAPVATTLILTGSLGLALGSQTLFSLLYYGDPLPNTYYLKLHGASMVDRLTRGAGSLAVVVARTSMRSSSPPPRWACGAPGAIRRGGRSCCS